MKKYLLLIVLVSAVCSNSFAYLTQGHFRWRNNNGTEKTATWKAGTDTAITISDLKAIRLRLDIDNAQTATKTLDRSLVYATSTAGPWYTITSNSAINAFNLSGDNGYIKNNDSTTLQIPDPTEAFLPGNMVTNGTPYTDSIPVGKRREYEWCFKPTALAQANTTYYFKANIGSNPNIYAALTTTGTAFVAAPKTIMTNGGFENNLTGWTTATTNSSSATYTITNAPLHVHGGSQALVVKVANTGTAGNSVTLSAPPVTLSDTGYYLLRFWALATSQNALLDLNLKSATSNNPCHYEIRTRIDSTQNGWVMYQYSFRAPVNGPMTVQFNFNTACTYYLDDVEIINSLTNPNYNVRMQYDWQNNFAETYRWQSGDNNNPILLPDGRVAWSYNDSQYGYDDSHTNVLSRFNVPHNLVVVQKGDSLKSIYGGTPPNALSLFDPGNGNEFWQSGGIIENGQLKIVLIEVANQSSYAGHTWIGSLNLPDLTVSTLHQLPATINVGPNCVFADGAYDYLYFGASSGANETHTVVGRVPAGQLDSQTAWQFYAGNNVWTTDFTKALNIVAGVSAGNVIKLGPNSYAMSGVPYVSQEIDVWFAQNPWGPWVNKTTVYNIPPEESVLPYEGHIYPKGNKGIYTFTWSLFPFNNDSGNEELSDKTIYVPDYAQANLFALSPFTPKKPTDSVTSFNAGSHGRQVTLNWTTALSTDINFIVQNSTDGTNWTTVATVAGNGTNSHQAIFGNPLNGTNYYRLESFDEDNVMSVSPVKFMQINSNAAVQALSIIPGDFGAVNISFNTASEFFNDHFTIQRTTDTTNWSGSKQIPGAGTTSTIQYYQFTDNPPVEAIYYYRLQYYSNGQLVYTPTIKADTRPSVILTSGYAVKQGTAVLLHLSTKSEVNSPGFTVQKSTDSSTWQTYLGLPGSGTTFVPQTYQTIDNNPATGLNYYRLLYYYQGVKVTSPTSVVNMADNSDIVFNVYPNPAKTNVSFALKGYTGTSFTATVTDLYGKPIGKQTLNVTQDGKYVLNTSMSPGTYILNINGNGLQKASRVMVQ